MARPPRRLARDFDNYFQLLLDRRNKVVHHFFEAYADDLEAERYAEILVSLASLHRELREVASAFRSFNEALLESLKNEQALAD